MRVDLNDLQKLGRLIRKTRQSQGFTQEAYAEQLGISHYLARDIEKGKPTVKLGNYIRYADELGIRLFADVPLSDAEAGDAGGLSG